MEHIRNGLFHQKESTAKYRAGFYWADETGDLNGPHDTLEQADIESRAYGEWLTNGDTHAPPPHRT